MSEANRSLGNITEFTSAEEFSDKFGAVALRFFLQAIARELLPEHRIKICWRYPLPQRETVDIIYSPERKKARAKGCMKCGNAWVCPPCNLYITERRRLELGAALKECRDKYVPFMVTYTASHGPQMGLITLMAQMQAAFSFMKSGRKWQSIKEEFALSGSIRATEITYGANGWHPHYHAIVLVDIHHIQDYFEGATAEYAEGLESALEVAWINALKKQKLSGKQGIALRVSDTNDASRDYILKYGKLPSKGDFGNKAIEVSKGMSKTARNGNLTPYEILFNAYTDGKMAALFIEYATATAGRSMLQWSRGLKKELHIDEISEKMAAEGIETETDVILAQIDTGLWKHIAKSGYLGQLMHVANRGEVDPLRRLILKIAEGYNPDLPDFGLHQIGH